MKCISWYESKAKSDKMSSTKMSSTKMSINHEVKNRTKRRYKNETLIQQELKKEKELLKQWKAARYSEKKTKLIVRKKAHDVRRSEKERFTEIDENDSEDRYIWKHVDCNEECLIDDCQQYILDYLCSGY